MTGFVIPRPAERDAKEIIPRGLLLGMAALALASLAIATFGVLTGQPHTGVPGAAGIVAERAIILEGHGAKAVTVRDDRGGVLYDLDHGGFVAVIQNGLQRARLVAGVDQALPVRLVRFANGRLTIIDPATGWSAELHAFGDDNRAAFERLMTN